MDNSTLPLVEAIPKDQINMYLIIYLWHILATKMKIPKTNLAQDLSARGTDFENVHFAFGSQIASRSTLLTPRPADYAITQANIASMMSSFLTQKPFMFVNCCEKIQTWLAPSKSTPTVTGFCVSGDFRGELNMILTSINQSLSVIKLIPRALEFKGLITLH